MQMFYVGKKEKGLSFCPVATLDTLALATGQKPDPKNKGWGFLSKFGFKKFIGSWSLGDAVDIKM